MADKLNKDAEKTCKWCNEPILPGDPSAYAPTVGYHEHMRCATPGAGGSMAVSSPSSDPTGDALASMRSLNKALTKTLTEQRDRADAAEARALAAEQRLATCRDLLGEIYDLVWREYPNLLKEANGFDSKLNLAIDAALASSDAAPESKEGE